MKHILAFAPLVASAMAAVEILLPLYVYPIGANNDKPYDGTVDWIAAIAAIDAHPDLTFNVIINPLSGPPFANEDGIKIDWAKWIGQINQRSNTKTLGYISTEGTVPPYIPRDEAIVKGAVDTYDSWTTAKDWDGVEWDISIDGVFFDEVNTEPAHLAYYTRVSQYAKAKPDVVVLNPGSPVNSASLSLYNEADFIVGIETCYTPDEQAPQDRCPRGYIPFTPASLGFLPTDAAQKAKTAVLVHDFYDDWEPYQPATLVTLQADINAIVAANVHSLYITQWGYNESFTLEPASVKTVSNLLALAQGLPSGQPV